MNRRKILKVMAAGAGAITFPQLTFSGTSSGTFSSTIKNKYRAVAFDAFPVFDPRPIFELTKHFFPEKGNQFADLWRTRIFEYTWLRTSANQYVDFWQCIDDALLFSSTQLGIKLSNEQHHQLMQAFLNLKPYPDVIPALMKLKAMGLKIAFLSNMTEKMLMNNIINSNLHGYFDHVISTDRAKTFKPSVNAYQLGIDTFGYRKEEIIFVAFASWDAVGAKWFGYPTVWINRLDFLPENLNIKPDHSGQNMAALLEFVS